MASATLRQLAEANARLSMCEGKLLASKTDRKTRRRLKQEWQQLDSAAREISVRLQSERQLGAEGGQDVEREQEAEPERRPHPIVAIVPPQQRSPGSAPSPRSAARSLDQLRRARSGSSTVATAEKARRRNNDDTGDTRVEHTRSGSGVIAGIMMDAMADTAADAATADEDCEVPRVRVRACLPACVPACLPAQQLACQ